MPPLCLPLTLSTLEVCSSVCLSICLYMCLCARTCGCVCVCLCVCVCARVRVYVLCQSAWAVAYLGSLIINAVTSFFFWLLLLLSVHLSCLRVYTTGGQSVGVFVYFSDKFLLFFVGNRSEYSLEFFFYSQECYLSNFCLLCSFTVVSCFIPSSRPPPPPPLLLRH